MRCSTRAASRPSCGASAGGKLIWVDRIASAILLLAPMVFILVQSPALIVLQIVAGLALLGDPRRGASSRRCRSSSMRASARRCRCSLRGRYLGAGDLPAARSVLKAAAYTYVAAALATLLDVARWFRILRF